jgi:4-hydroxybenzoate polyprenyltransferase
MDLNYIKMLRPRHWVKNFVVLLPLIFAMKVDSPAAIVDAVEAAVIFCLLSSFVYIINDLKDIENDRLHPHKKTRPIAAGKVSAAAALATAVSLIAVVFLWTYFVLSEMLPFVGAYLGLQIAYSFGLKRAVLVDVICIALGFVIRASAGAAAIDVDISPWLFICMFTVCLFMGFCKRYNEKAAFDTQGAAIRHRDTLSEYTPELLTHLITLSAGLAVIGFISYAMSPQTIARYGSENLVYTLPLVVYAVFRFAMISMKARYEGPTDIILSDRPFQAATAAWGLWVFAVINWPLIVLFFER